MNLPMPKFVTTLRPECGYSATRYDSSADRTPKILRRRFGCFCDVKKIRNTNR